MDRHDCGSSAKAQEQSRNNHGRKNNHRNKSKSKNDHEDEDNIFPIVILKGRSHGSWTNHWHSACRIMSLQYNGLHVVDTVCDRMIQ
jgi:hypothetical protein